MKRLIFILISVMFFSFVYSQSEPEEKQSLLETLPTDQLNAVERVYVDFSQKIEGLAQTLKVPAEQVWTILVKTEKLKGVSALLIFLVTLVMIIALLIPAYKLAKWENDASFWDVVAIIFTICAVIWMISFPCCLTNIITRINVPEYWAIKDIMEAF